MAPFLITVLPSMPVPLNMMMDAWPAVVSSMTAYTPGRTDAVICLASAPLANAVPLSPVTAASCFSWSRKSRSLPAHGLFVESSRFCTTHTIGLDAL